MYIFLVLLVTIALVVYNNYKGWYSLSEYIACFGAGWIVCLLVEYLV